MLLSQLPTDPLRDPDRLPSRLDVGLSGKRGEAFQIGDADRLQQPLAGIRFAAAKGQEMTANLGSLQNLTEHLHVIATAFTAMQQGLLDVALEGEREIEALEQLGVAGIEVGGLITDEGHQLQLHVHPREQLEKVGEQGTRALAAGFREHKGENFRRNQGAPSLPFSRTQQLLPGLPVAVTQGLDQLKVLTTAPGVKQALLAQKGLVGLEPVLDVGGGRLVDAHMQHQGAWRDQPMRRAKWIQANRTVPARLQPCCAGPAGSGAPGGRAAAAGRA